MALNIPGVASAFTDMEWKVPEESRHPTQIVDNFLSTKHVLSSPLMLGIYEFH